MFADDQSPPVWHVVPDGPALETREGEPAFLVVKYRVDPSRGDWTRGGGLLRLQCSLRIPDQALGQARALLIAQSDGALQNIVPLQPEHVTCELLVGLGDLTEQSIVPGRPSAQPPFGASFDVPLSIEGATIFADALKAGLSPGAISYSLTFKARSPRLPAKVTIDWTRLTQLAQVRATTVKQHVERGDIRIEITHPEAGTSVFDRVMEEVSHIVASQRPPNGVLRGPSLFDLSQPREEERVILPGATLRDLLGALGPGFRPESLIAHMEEVSHG